MVVCRKQCSTLYGFSKFFNNCIGYCCPIKSCSTSSCESEMYCTLGDVHLATGCQEQPGHYKSCFLPNSSTSTREWTVACLSMLAVSLSSTKNVLSPKKGNRTINNRLYLFEYDKQEVKPQNL